MIDHRKVAERRERLALIDERGAKAAAELLDAKPVPGQPDMVMGECGHPMTGEDWCDGWRVCKRCPQASLFEFPEPTVPKGTPPGRWP